MGASGVALALLEAGAAAGFVGVGAAGTHPASATATVAKTTTGTAARRMIPLRRILILLDRLRSAGPVATDSRTLVWGGASARA